MTPDGKNFYSILNLLALFNVESKLLSFYLFYLLIYILSESLTLLAEFYDDKFLLDFDLS